jgi:predicted outer membrane repeat protein
LATPECPTIADAIGLAESYSNADVAVDIAPAVYDENDTITVPASDSLSLIGASPSTTTVDGLGRGTVFVVNSGSLEISNLTIENGSATDGGGLTNIAATTVLAGDTFTGNTATFGGAIYNSGTLTLSSDTLSGNSTSSAGAGGAIYNVANLTIVNSTLASDSATGTGGAIYNSSSATLTDDTLSSDSATVGGGGIYNSGGTTAIANSILDAAPCLAPTGSVFDGGRNVSSDNSCGFGSTSISSSSTINLGPLAPNGSAGPETEAIGPGSSAFEEVPLAACTISSDERGDPRPGVAGQSCDAGAYEYQGSFNTNSAPQFVVDSPPATAAQNLYYSYTFEASGNPTPTYYLASGGLPPGLSLDDSTGQLSGYPTTTGTYYFTIGAENGISPSAFTTQLSITVYANSGTTTTTTVPVTTTTTAPPPESKAQYCRNNLGYSGNQAFICLAYFDILFRAPDSGGLATYAAQLSSGTSREQVVAELLNSDEYHRDIVESIYERYLMRPADPGGLATYTGQLDAGATPDQVIAEIAGSDEFYNAAGGTADDYVTRLYNLILSRAPDSGGLATYTSQLSSGTSREQVAAELLGSNEYHQDQVEVFYALFLGRSADPGGLATYTGQLNAGTSYAQVEAELVGSNEFYNDATG